MLNLRIYIREENGRRWFIPAPLWLLKAGAGMGAFGIRLAKKRMTEEEYANIENIDFEELKRAIDILKAYKGLQMVDVRSKDGTEVRIII